MSKQRTRRLALALLAVGVVATGFGAWRAQALPANGWVTYYYSCKGGVRTKVGMERLTCTGGLVSWGVKTSVYETVDFPCEDPAWSDGVE